MPGSLTVTWPKESWNRDHISYCCCNVEVPEHWIWKEGAVEVLYWVWKAGGMFIPCALSCPLPFGKQQINQEHKMSVYFPFPPTLCLAFEDRAGWQSCLKQCLFPVPFPHGLARACGFSWRGGQNVCEPSVGAESPRWPGAGAAGAGEVGSCDSDSGSGYSRTSLLSVAKLTKPPVKEQAPSTGGIHVHQEDFAVGAALGYRCCSRLWHFSVVWRVTMCWLWANLGSWAGWNSAFGWIFSCLNKLSVWSPACQSGCLGEGSTLDVLPYPACDWLLTSVVALTYQKLWLSISMQGIKPDFEERLVTYEGKMVVFWWKDWNGSKTVQRLLFWE